MEGHHRNKYKLLPDYMATSAANPLMQGKGMWCEICRVCCHIPSNGPIMQKYEVIVWMMFNEFCKSIEHDIAIAT